MEIERIVIWILELLVTRGVMNRIKILFMLVLTIPIYYSGLDLIGGLSRISDMPDSLEGLKEYFLSNSLPEESISYLKNDRSDYSYFTLNEDIVVFDVDLTPRSSESYYVDERVNSRLQLTRWQHHFFNPEFVIWNESVASDLTEDGNYWPKLFLNTELENIGCYSAKTLRYGDVGNDGNDDLIMFLGSELLVFSPKEERVIFSLQYHLDDWMTAEETTAFYDGGAYGISEGDILPQYQSKTSGYAIERLQIVASAYRGHSKVFQGDLDDDGHSDLIVWNKLYRSRSNSDLVVGFELISNTWIHYERDLTAQAESPAGVTGEYLPQDTPEADIQKWLAENNLTWSKGYPSTSECAGEEGQLIPEMHDPLLNDPEVLQ